MTNAFRSPVRCGDRAARAAVSAVVPRRVARRPVPPEPHRQFRRKTGEELRPRRCLRAGHRRGHAAAGAALRHRVIHSLRPGEWGRHALLQGCEGVSIDHIHPGAVRRRAGRPPTGRLALSR